ncbi:MAG: ATP-binding protein [Paracoccus sp. (in: a-proteobacteria)]|nr:ATP-binding protein [Paracoccus sp. (in: a-proteobacteria)]
MRRLSSYFFRVAGLSVLVAVAVIALVMTVGDWLNWEIFKAGLSPELLAGLQSDIEADPALNNALIAHYNSWQSRMIVPGSIMVGTLAGAFVGMVHSRRLMRPLDAVALAAARLAQGDTAARADARPSRIAQIDAFQNNFNAMADAVARSERELRETNAAIAHELRTPLTVLIGRLNGMLDGIFPADRDGIGALLAQTTLLQRIIDDLKLVTLADAGRFRFDPESFDMAELVSAVVALEPAGIEMALNPAPVYADPARLRQITAALLDNARRYGGAELRVETGVTGAGSADGPVQAMLRVMDRGPGLPPDQAGHAFDRFWRADKSRGKQTGGSGLGLAVVRSLTEAQGGNVAYAPRPGGGAIFTVTLPSGPRGA